MFRRVLGHHLTGWRLQIWIGLKRTSLGLQSDQKPGDIDILLIPELDGDRFVEKTMSVEVKRAYIPENKLGKSPSSFGIKQTNGMIKDGFPYVGLLHFLFVESASEQYRTMVPIVGNKLKNGELQTVGETEFAISGLHVANRHEGRILESELSNEAGYNLKIFQFDERNPGFIWANACENRSPSKNLITVKRLLDELRELALEPDFILDFGYNEMKLIEAKGRQMFRMSKNRIDSSWREFTKS